MMATARSISYQSSVSGQTLLFQNLSHIVVSEHLTLREERTRPNGCGYGRTRLRYISRRIGHDSAQLLLIVRIGTGPICVAQRCQSADPTDFRAKARWLLPTHIRA